MDLRQAPSKSECEPEAAFKPEAGCKSDSERGRRTGSTRAYGQAEAGLKPSQLESARGRDVAAILDPCPVAIIGAAGKGGSTGLATVIWAMPVSHQPAMTAFALRAKSHTMGLIRESGFFSMSTLPADEEGVRITELCGNNTGHRVDKTAAVSCELVSIPPLEDAAPHQAEENTAQTQPAEANAAPATRIEKLPVPEHALSWEICAVESIQEAGDHLLVVGRVLRAASRASRDDKNRLAPKETLLCIQHGAYAPAGETIPCS